MMNSMEIKITHYVMYYCFGSFNYLELHRHMKNLELKWFEHQQRQYYPMKRHEHLSMVPIYMAGENQNSLELKCHQS